MNVVCYSCHHPPTMIEAPSGSGICFHRAEPLECCRVDDVQDRRSRGLGNFGLSSGQLRNGVSSVFAVFLRPFVGEFGSSKLTAHRPPPTAHRRRPAAPFPPRQRSSDWSLTQKREQLPCPSRHRRFFDFPPLRPRSGQLSTGRRKMQ